MVFKSQEQRQREKQLREFLRKKEERERKLKEIERMERIQRESAEQYNAGLEQYGYSKSGILERFARDRRASIDAEDVFFASIIVVALAGFAAIGHFVTTSIIWEKNYDEVFENGQQNFDDLSKAVAAKVGLYGLDLRAANLEMVEQGGLLSFYGQYIRPDQFGGSDIVSVSSKFLVNHYLASSIMQTVDSLKSVSPEFTEIKIKEKAQINEGYKKLFQLFSQCVNEQYIGTTEIGEASSVQKMINNEYTYSSPNVVSNTTVGGMFAHGSTTYIKAGHNVMNISQVYYDEETSKHFFYIDTACGNPDDEYKSVTYHRARVDVYGAEELSEAEVYGRFLAGQHDKFVEVTTPIIEKQIGEHFVSASYVGRQM